MDFLPDITTPEIGLFGINLIFKLLFFVLLVGYVFYAFLLVLRIRILADTVETPHGRLVQLASLVHLLVALIGGFLALVVILLA